jgi:hypothetical protein
MVSCEAILNRVLQVICSACFLGGRPWLITFICLSPTVLMAQSTIPAPAVLPQLGDRLTVEQGSALAQLALAGLDREFPNKPSNVLGSVESVVPPKELFPAFYGCFDWHSSVHGHWLLVRVLREWPQGPLAGEIRSRLSAHFTADNLAKEAAFFADDLNKSYERMYGWAWLLRLVTELHSWEDPDAKVWRANLRPLEEVLVRRCSAYLPLLSYPIRTGEHPDTGFALGQILDYARTVGNRDLEELAISRARDYFLADREYPARYEPSGQDFFSSGWNEADLMRRILPPNEFAQWLDGFLPGLAQNELGPFLQPVEVTDVTDGKLVHLAGLNLSRAWCQNGIANALPEHDPRKDILFKAAREHTQAGLKTVFSGHYEGEHWLGTFALYTLAQVAVDR